METVGTPFRRRPLRSRDASMQASAGRLGEPSLPPEVSGHCSCEEKLADCFPIYGTRY
jgi:hypothetical protein